MARPNIVFILIDDMGWKDLACTGSTFYETPNIDSLARHGMRFTDAYAACPVCSPTRASLLTGKYPARVGVTNFIGGHTQGRLIDAPYLRYLPAEEVSLATALNSAGYHTWHVGKWHLGGAPSLPQDHGFEVNVAGCEWGHPKNGYFSPWGVPGYGDDGREGEYLTDRLTDEAVRLIRDNDGAPFFLNMWYYAVHTPIQAKADLADRFRQKAADRGLDQVRAFADGEPFPCEHKKDKRVRRRLIQSDPAYAAMIATLDANIGRLLAALEATGVADNTIVIFTSDNGGLATAEGSPTCNAPLAEGKGWMYEGGTREPLLVRWPGVVEPGSTCEVPVTSPDVYPTLLAAAGLPPRPEQHADGENLMPLLNQTDGLERDAIFWHYPHYGNQGGTPGCSMRAGEWKLIEFFEDNRLELYNLRDDPGESRDLTASDPGRTRAMHDRLVAWRNSVNALIPEPNPNY
ncbi:MAG: sulfatase [Planctomycetota bacterium]